MLISQMRQRLERCESFEQAIETVLADAIGLQGAEFGNVQLLVEGELVIVAQRGFSLRFLETFRRVNAEHGTACGRALRSGAPILISDVEKDSEFAPFRTDAKLAGFRAVQSTPLISTVGKRLGIVSAHFVKPRECTQIEMDALRVYASIAAEFLFRQLGDVPLTTMAGRMSDELDAQTRAKNKLMMQFAPGQQAPK